MDDHQPDIVTNVPAFVDSFIVADQNCRLQYHHLRLKNNYSDIINYSNPLSYTTPIQLTNFLYSRPRVIIQYYLHVPMYQNITSILEI